MEQNKVVISTEEYMDLIEISTRYNILCDYYKKNGDTYRFSDIMEAVTGIVPNTGREED